MSSRRPRPDVVAEIERTGVVAVMRLKDASVIGGVARALADGGLTALEVTMTVPGAVDLIAELAATLPAACVIGAHCTSTSSPRNGPITVPTVSIDASYARRGSIAPFGLPAVPDV